MAILWTEIAPVLIQVFSEIAADANVVGPAFRAEWKEGQRSATNTGQRFSLLLKVTSVVGLGNDETREEYIPGSPDPNTGYVQQTQVGQRKFTLQAQVIVPEHTDSFWAMAVTERMRTRLYRPRTREQLIDANVSIIDMLQAVKVTFKDGGRMVSAASMDFIFGTSVNDDDDVPLGWFDRIELNSHISDTDGLQVPAALQQINHVVPEP